MSKIQEIIELFKSRKDYYRDFEDKYALSDSKLSKYYEGRKDCMKWVIEVLENRNKKNHPSRAETLFKKWLES